MSIKRAGSINSNEAASERRIGIALQALSTFGMIALLGRDWEERRHRERMEGERRRG